MESGAGTLEDKSASDWMSHLYVGEDPVAFGMEDGRRAGSRQGAARTERRVPGFTTTGGRIHEL